MFWEINQYVFSIEVIVGGCTGEHYMATLFKLTPETPIILFSATPPRTMTSIINKQQNYHLSDRTIETLYILNPKYVIIIIPYYK